MRYSLIITVVLCFTASEMVVAQSYQKSYQKGGPATPEAGEENDPKGGGGYAAPPRSGTMAGPTNSIGIEGLEIEIPALKLKLPKLKLPGLTRYSKMPRMVMDEAVAPFVQNFRREFSMEAGVEDDGGAPEAGIENKAGHPLQKPSQKSGYPITPAQASAQQQQLENRIRDLEQLLVRVESQLSASTKKDQAVSNRRTPDVSRNEPLSQQPRLLPAVAVARPASFESPVYPETVPTNISANAPSSSEQIDELRDLVLTLQQQQSQLLHQIRRQHEESVRYVDYASKRTNIRDERSGNRISRLPKVN